MSNITSIILVLASLGLFFGYVNPTYMNIKGLQQNKADYDIALSNSKELQSERDTLLAKYNSMSKSDLAKLSKLLPDNIDNIRLIIEIDDMAKTFGMRIRDFKTDTNQNTDTIGADNTPYGTLNLSFSTTAPYNTFLAFIHSLEESLRISNINSIQFSSSDTNALYDYAVTVKTYWLK